MNSIIATLIAKRSMSTRSSGPKSIRMDGQRITMLMLLFVPLAYLGDHLEWNAILVFLFSGFAIIPLASIIASATESIADRVGFGLGGLLNATFGNATEMIIAIVALSEGLVDLVKASIAGTLIANLLLAMGLAIFTGGIKYKEQTFNRSVARINASSLNLALTVMLAPAAIRATSQATPQSLIDAFSLIASILLLAYYGLTLVFSMRTHRGLYETGDLTKNGEHSRVVLDYSQSRLPFRPVVSLLVASIVLTLVSELLIRSLEHSIETLHLPPFFTGVILIPLFGGAVEYLAAIRFARKNKIDLALAIATGSSLQIAMFVAPLLVIIGCFLEQPMNLDFHPFELLAIGVAVFITNSISNDGRSHWLEGVLLLVAYLILATAFFLHP